MSDEFASKDDYYLSKIEEHKATIEKLTKTLQILADVTGATLDELIIEINSKGEPDDQL